MRRTRNPRRDEEDEMHLDCGVARMDCCNCLRPDHVHDSDSHYQPLTMHPPPSHSHELLLVSESNNQPLVSNISLTVEGLVMVKYKSARATSTRLIPYLSLLACSFSHAPSPSPSPSTLPDTDTTLSISALVPSKKNDPNSPLKLWTLTGKVHEIGPHPDQPGSPTGLAASDAERWRCAVEEWCREAEEKAYVGVERHRRLHVVVNPAGGKGKAKRIWKSTVKPVLEAAGAKLDVSFTGPSNSPNNATTLARSHNPQAYDALVALSGDGIIYELLNGLASHTSGEGARVLRETPVVHIACGSGNALATSLVGPEKVDDAAWGALTALKGKPIPLDLSSITQPSHPAGERTLSAITQAFGLMADLDTRTEHLRWMGDTRFTYGYAKGALARVSYPCKVSILLPPKSVYGGGIAKESIARHHNNSLSTPPASGSVLEAGPTEENAHLPELKYGTIHDPLPDGPTWTHLPSQEELAKLADLDDEEGEGGQWIHLDLEEKGVFFGYGGKMPFIAKDVMLFPVAHPNDGLIDLALVEPMGSLAALSAMDGIDKGASFSHPKTFYLKCLAYRLTFPPKPPGERDGCLTVDGEAVKYEGIQVEVHKGLGRVLSLSGRGWEGRRRLEGSGNCVSSTLSLTLAMSAVEADLDRFSEDAEYAINILDKKDHAQTEVVDVDFPALHADPCLPKISSIQNRHNHRSVLFYLSRSTSKTAPPPAAKLQPVSPKSVHRSAHLLELPDLSALALANFSSQLTVNNAVVELFSDTTAYYDQVFEVTLQYVDRRFEAVRVTEESASSMMDQT
ncbi:hypothetical protein JCM11641_002825 [Rhodosporidiobolus odoratus]